jgi:hypothetical protein
MYLLRKNIPTLTISAKIKIPPTVWFAVLSAFSLFPAPIERATITVLPTHNPMGMLFKSQDGAAFTPTVALASLPSDPTIAVLIIITVLAIKLSTMTGPAMRNVSLNDPNLIFLNINFFPCAEDCVFDGFAAAFQKLGDFAVPKPRQLVIQRFTLKYG